MSVLDFWAVVFFFAFFAFTLVSALIAVKGVDEIRVLFRHLERGQPPRGDGDDERGSAKWDRRDQGP